MGTIECSQPASKFSWDSQDFGDNYMLLKMAHFRKSTRPRWVKWCRDRIVVLYKILHGLVNIPPESVDITKSNRIPRGASNPHKLQPPRAQRKSSPLWNSTIFRTIPQWIQLPASIAEADSLTTFKSRLVCSSP